jgi:hypothetical protein
MTEQTNQPAAEEEREINVTTAIDGATSLSEAASLAHGHAAELRRLHDEGFVLRGPITDGKGTAYKPEGENPNLVGDHAHLHQHEHHEPVEEPDRGFVQF